MADKKRAKGNFYFRRDEFPFASNCYDKALSLLTTNPNGEDSPEKRDLVIKLLNNLAATQLRLSAYDSAIKSCDELLSFEPTNHKALYRKAKAHLSLGDTCEAIKLLDHVLKLVPSSQLAKSELERATRAIQQERKQFAKAASKWFPLAPHLRKETRAKRSFLSRNAWKLASLLTLFLSMLTVYLFATSTVDSANESYQTQPAAPAQ
ncbi:Peptidyl-prolyl cis-trans isomerase fkbp8 [Cichlidogyrus casuarinus]|uniref:Peptidyl-prolyl cis-trans isomerase fkbp8 n=1 Tax=Cichlidogyrus casuarinus TaxID=1844966 RepID=A0ABD2Q7A0_9PLAT